MLDVPLPHLPCPTSRPHLPSPILPSKPHLGLHMPCPCMWSSHLPWLYSLIAKASPRSEVYVARALIIVDLTTAALSAVCLGITIGTRAFHRIPTPHT